jgi:hypothetical protein
VENSLQCRRAVWLCQWTESHQSLVALFVTGTRRIRKTSKSASAHSPSVRFASTHRAVPVLPALFASLRMPSTSGHTLRMTGHTVYALARLGEHQLLDRLFAGATGEASSMIGFVTYEMAKSSDTVLGHLTVSHSPSLSILKRTHRS